MSHETFCGIVLVILTAGFLSLGTWILYDSKKSFGKIDSFPAFLAAIALFMGAIMLASFWVKP